MFGMARGGGHGKANEVSWPGHRVTSIEPVEWVRLAQQSQIRFHFAGVKLYLLTMTKLLEKALEAVRQLPPESQDQIAPAMLSLSGNEGEPEEVDPAHLPAVLEGLAQAKRRHIAADAEVEAAFRRFER